MSTYDMCHVSISQGWFKVPVLGHVLGRHVPEYVLEHMPGPVLKHLPEYALKHVPKHVLRYMLDKHLLNQMAHAVLRT